MANYTLSNLHTDPASGISYRIRQAAPDQPRKLLVLLHGVGSNEQDLLALADGVDPYTLVVLGRGPIAMGPQQFAWFRVAFTQTGPQIAPEEAESSRRALITLLQQLQAHHGIAASESVVAGFSQGGIMSASVALSTPQRVKGFALLSGRILPELEPHLADRTQLAALRAFVGHGTQDNTLPVFWADRSDAWLAALGVPLETHRYPMGHTISAAMHADFLHWLAETVT